MHTSRSGDDRSVTLKEYIDASNLSYEGFAQLVPCSPTYPWMIANGKANPGFKMACRIEALTGGVVPRTNWYPDAQDSEQLEELDDDPISKRMKEIKK